MNMNLPQIQALFSHRLIEIARTRSFTAQLVVGQASEFPKPRDFAHCQRRPGGLIVVTIAPKLIGQPMYRVDALLRHELAHGLLLTLKQPHSERDCDRTAELVFGAPIRYDAEDVQTLGPGVWPRPSHLKK
jgi:hypothetical protein